MKMIGGLMKNEARAMHWFWLLILPLVRRHPYVRELEFHVEMRFTSTEVAQWLSAYPHPRRRELTLREWVNQQRLKTDMEGKD